jgi:hypothetical protein
MELGAERRPAPSPSRSGGTGNQSRIDDRSETRGQSGTGKQSGARKPPRRATLVRPGEMWGRRSVGVGVLLIAIALIGGLILLISGGDDNDSGSATKSTADVAALQNRFLDRTVVNIDKVSKAHGVTNIQSKDRCLVMQLSAPVPAARAKALRKDGITVLRDQFKNAKVQPAASSQTGGVPTRSDTITFKDPKGNNVRVLLSVGTGQKNAYLTEVVVRDPSCQGDLQLAQLMLGSAQFTK